MIVAQAVWLFICIGIMLVIVGLGHTVGKMSESVDNTLFLLYSNMPLFYMCGAATTFVLSIASWAGLL